MFEDPGYWDDVEMIEDAKKGKFSIVLVNSIDRLGRQKSIITKALDILFELNLKVYINSDQVENNLLGRAISGVLGQIAENDKESNQVFRCDFKIFPSVPDPQTADHLDPGSPDIAQGGSSFTRKPCPPASSPHIV